MEICLFQLKSSNLTVYNFLDEIEIRIPILLL